MRIRILVSLLLLSALVSCSKSGGNGQATTPEKAGPQEKKSESTLPPPPKETVKQEKKETPQKSGALQYRNREMAVKFWEAWFDSKPYEYMFENGHARGDLLGWGRFCGGPRGFLYYGSVMCVLEKLAGVKAGECNFVDDPNMLNPVIKGLSGHELMGENPDAENEAFPFYAPMVIRWAAENLIPPPDAVIKGHKAKDVYDRIFADNLRLHATVYVILQKLGMTAEVAAYRAGVIDGRVDGLEWLNKRYGTLPVSVPWARDAGGCTTVPYVAGFWLRRTMDGTASHIAHYMYLFFKDFDPGFLKELGPDAQYLGM